MDSFSSSSPPPHPIPVHPLRPPAAVQADLDAIVARWDVRTAEATACTEQAVSSTEPLEQLLPRVHSAWHRLAWDALERGEPVPVPVSDKTGGEDGNGVEDDVALVPAPLVTISGRAEVARRIIGATTDDTVPPNTVRVLLTGSVELTVARPGTTTTASTPVAVAVLDLWETGPGRPGPTAPACRGRVRALRAVEPWLTRLLDDVDVLGAPGEDHPTQAMVALAEAPPELLELVRRYQQLQRAYQTLGERPPSAKDFADSLFIGERTLRRRLQKWGVSWKAFCTLAFTTPPPHPADPTPTDPHPPVPR